MNGKPLIHFTLLLFIGVFLFSFSFEVPKVFTKNNKTDFFLLKKKSDFDSVLFMRKADSIFEKLRGQKTTLTFKKTETSINFSHWPSYKKDTTMPALICKSSEYETEIKESKNSLYSFNFKIISLPDSATGRKLYQRLSKETFKAPGLTYTFDSLYFTDSTVYWLNATCSLSGDAFSLINKEFKKSIRNRIRFSLNCRCGSGCK